MKTSRVFLAGFGLCACAGSVDTPEPEALGGDGGSVSTAGRGGRGGSASVSDAGAAGRGGAPNDGGSGGGAGDGAGDEPDAGMVVTPRPPREYCDAVETVFRPSCGNGSCHTNRGATIGDFGAGQAEAASYVGRGSVRDAACGLIIDPVEPQNSLILTKVTGTYPSGMNCGGRMPVGSFEITDDQIDCISDWVEQFRDE